MRQEEKNKKEKNIFGWIILIFYISSAFFCSITEYFQSENIVFVLKKVILIILLQMLLFFFLKEKQKIFEKNTDLYFWLIISFYLSFIGILTANFYPSFHLWMLGSVIIAMVIDCYLGIGFHLFFTCVLFLLNPMSVESLIFSVIIGSLLCLFSKYKKNSYSFLYMMIIISCIDIALWLVLHNFNSKTFLSWQLVFSVGSIIIVYFLSCMAQFIYKNKKKKEIEEKRKEEKQIWEQLTRPDSELLLRLQQYSKTLYIHSIDVGEIAFRAALEIECNAMLTKAGGFYHEIGRINGNSYIEEGIKIAVQAHFPEELITVIRQHNAKIEKPQSKEAAVVLLTDNLLSTLEYMERQEEIQNISKEDLIQSVFENRLQKGVLDDCGLSLGDFQALRYFYLYNCF